MSKLTLHHYFGSSMILQREAHVTVKGRAEAGSGILLRLQNSADLSLVEEALTTTTADGRWSAVLGAQVAGGPYELLVSSTDAFHRLTDIYFGDVFVLAGQSNMELPLSRCQDELTTRFAGYEDRLIRELKPTMSPVFGREAEDWQEGGAWTAATAESLPGLSALGLSFARKYKEAVDVPVGLLMLAVGGSPIESWLPLSDLADEPVWAEIESRFRDEAYKEALVNEEQAKVGAWYERLQGEVMPANGWSSFEFPQSLIGSELEDYSGTVWLKRCFDLSEAEVRLYSGGLLRLGSMIDADYSYLNGEMVGETGYRYPPRRYPLPAGLLRIGTNELVIRLMVHQGRGGIIKGPFYGLEAGAARLDLSGTWSLSMGIAMPAMPATTTLHYLPSGLYQGQLAPIKDLPIAGTLWYQGEGNDSRPDNYEQRFRELISMWKGQFGETVPFVYAQLSAFEDPAGRIDPEAWAKIREAQRRVENVTGTAMVITVDCGEREDLHPQDKWTVGVRADLAMRRLLGRLKPGEVARSPEVESIEYLDNGLIEVSIKANDEALYFPGNVREAIRVYSKVDHQWQEPDSVEIMDNTIVVRGDQIRYNYEASPIEIQIRNAAGLPLSPFEGIANG